MSKPASNAHTPQPFVRIDMDRFLENYMRMEDALKKIAEYGQIISPQIQAMNMRKIAREALGL